MKRPALRWLAIATAALPLLVPGWGCGGKEEHDSATKYSPESLAQELAFRYKGLAPNAKKVSKTTRPRTKPDSRVDDQYETKSATKDQSKTAKTANVDELITEIAEKVKLIPGMSEAEATKKLIEAINNESSIPAEARKAITERLQPASGS